MPVRRPTQADVARAAGVSQTTVSIVLNRAAGTNVRLAAATRQRVLDALEATGYVVNPIARSLAGHRTNILGVFGFEPVFGSNSESFYLPFMEGIEQAAEAAARDLLLFASAARDGSNHHIYLRNVNRLALVDACVLIGNAESQVEISRLADEGYPFVFIGRREIPGVEVPYVTADYTAATRDVVQRLHSLGHEHVVYLSAGRELPSSIERYVAASAALSGLGLSTQTIVAQGRDHVRELEAALRHGATAILAEPLVDVETLADDLESFGLSTPADVSVIVMGDAINTSRSQHYWSGYRMPRQVMGRVAVEMLVEMLDSSSTAVKTRVIPCIPEKGRTVASAKKKQGKRMGRKA